MERREGRSREAHCLQLGLKIVLALWLGLGLNLPWFSISVDIAIRSGLIPCGSWEETSNASCLRALTGKHYAGLAGPNALNSGPKLSAHFCSSTKGLRIFFKRFPVAGRICRPPPKAVAQTRGDSYWECFSTAWLGVLLARLFGLTVALRVGCGTTCTLHTMLRDHLSSWFF